MRMGTPSAVSWPARVQRDFLERWHGGRVALPEIEYPQDVEVRRVYPGGHLKWRGATLFIGIALGGELVGLHPIGDGLHEMRYGPVFLGVLDERRPARGLIHHDQS